MKKSNIMSVSALFLGIMLAVATMAFKPVVKNDKGRAMYTFYYNGPDYTVSNVEDEANWAFVNSTDLCDFVDEKACRIQIDESYVDNSGSSPTLKPAANITATEYTTGVSYVSSTADGSAVISNSPQ